MVLPQASPCLVLPRAENHAWLWLTYNCSLPAFYKEYYIVFLPVGWTNSLNKTCQKQKAMYDFHIPNTTVSQPFRMRILSLSHQLAERILLLNTCEYVREHNCYKLYWTCNSETPIVHA